jgi:hypothetical protein
MNVWFTTDDITARLWACVICRHNFLLLILVSCSILSYTNNECEEDVFASIAFLYHGLPENLVVQKLCCFIVRIIWDGDRITTNITLVHIYIFTIATSLNGLVEIRLVGWGKWIAICVLVELIRPSLNFLIEEIKWAWFQKLIDFILRLTNNLTSRTLIIRLTCLNSHHHAWVFCTLWNVIRVSNQFGLIL